MTNKNKDNMAVSSVCRIDKKNNYTIMGNCHLRSKNLSLKAIGLLSKVLSLPEGWDFSVAGLASICKEGKQAIKSALDELAEWGYLELTKLTPDKTASGRIEYVYKFNERSDKDVLSDTITDRNACSGSVREHRASCDTYQGSVKQEAEKLGLESQAADNQATEKQSQINTDNQINNNKLMSNESSINQSVSSNNSVEKSAYISMDRYSAELERYIELVKENIDYCDFVDWLDNEA